jgi:uncharacterized lipoprotein YehR (DUF1307 family)
MRTTRTVLAAFVAVIAISACGKKNNETADTTTIPGIDTTKGMAMPTTDTVVKTTTTDTLQGQVKRSEVKAGTKTKTKAPTKSKTD